METPDPHKSELITTYGRYFDIDFGNLDTVVAQLQSPEQSSYLQLAKLEKSELPKYFNTVTLEYWNESSEPQPRATILLDPELFLGFERWAQYFRTSLQKELTKAGDTTLTTPHEENALYVPLSTSKAVRIGTEATLEECAIQLEVVSFFDLEEKRRELTAIDVLSDTSQKEDLITFTNLLGASLDTLVEVFVDDQRGVRYLIELRSLENLETEPEAATSIALLGSKALVSITNEGEDVRKTAYGVPEVEMGANREGFASIGGMFSAKQHLREFAESYGATEARALFGITPTHFLLHGAPGTGKTSLVEAFGHEIGAAVEYISPTDVSSKWVGESAKNLEEKLKTIIDRQQEAVILFDEADAIIGKQADGSNQTEAKRLLQSLITDITQNHSNIVIAATTNASLDDLDPAIIRPGRLEPIAVPLPNETERRDIWATVIANTRAQLDTEWKSGDTPHTPEFIALLDIASYDYEALAKQTHGWTGADMVAATKRALGKRYHHYKATKQKLPVETEQLLEAIAMRGRS